MLRHVLATEKVSDFQDWRSWRRLVVATAEQVLSHVGGTLVVPQSVLVREYWNEIRAGLVEAGIPVRHVVLHSSRDELVRRIECDTVEVESRQWRLDHLDAYENARSWLTREAEALDTTGLDPTQVAALVVAGVGSPASARTATGTAF